MIGHGTYVVTFEIDDPDRSMGELKAAARELTRDAADRLGFGRLGPCDVRVTHGADPRVIAEQPVSWTGPAPDARGEV